MKRKLKLKLPTMRELVAGVRTGVRPGQVFKDKRRKARVHERAQVREEMSNAADHR